MLLSASSCVGQLSERGDARLERISLLPGLLEGRFRAAARVPLFGGCSGSRDSQGRTTGGGGRQRASKASGATLKYSTVARAVSSRQSLPLTHARFKGIQWTRSLCTVNGLMSMNQRNEPFTRAPRTMNDARKPLPVQEGNTDFMPRPRLLHLDRLTGSTTVS